MQEHEILKYASRRAGEVGEAARNDLSRSAHRMRRFNQRCRWSIRFVQRAFDLRGDDCKQRDDILRLLRVRDGRLQGWFVHIGYMTLAMVAISC